MSRMISGMEGREASTRYDDALPARALREMSMRCSADDRIWFCKTTMIQRTISCLVGCFGAGWILCFCEKQAQ